VGLVKDDKLQSGDSIAEGPRQLLLLTYSLVLIATAAQDLVSEKAVGILPVFIQPHLLVVSSYYYGVYSDAAIK
jgi:hypothetical protein